MTKQEEIREVIDAYTDDVCLYQDNPCEYQGKAGLEVYCRSAEGSYRCLMKRLDELGMVIKVDRELPKDKDCTNTRHAFLGAQEQYAFDTAYFACQQDMLKAGYVAVEPLIEEK